MEQPLDMHLADEDVTSFSGSDSDSDYHPRAVVSSHGVKAVSDDSHAFLGGLPSPPPEDTDLDSPSKRPPLTRAAEAFTIPCGPNKRLIHSPPTTPSSLKSPAVLTPPKKRYRFAACSPDRFVPIRSNSDAAIDSFHSSKSPHELCPEERLLRHQSADSDPFGSAPITSRPGFRDSFVMQGRRPYSASPLGPSRNGGVLGVRTSSASLLNRQASLGGVWSFGVGSGDSYTPTTGISNGRGGFMGSGTNAPMYTCKFFDGDKPRDDSEKHEGRIALALNMDRANRILGFGQPGIDGKRGDSCDILIHKHGILGVEQDDGHFDNRTKWKYNQWVKDDSLKSNKKQAKILDAPRLRDDFYCSLIAYSTTARCLAVGLQNSVFLWSELKGVEPCNLIPPSFAYVTSLAFSSAEGHQSILAIGRADGKLTLWSTSGTTARLEAQHQSSIACVSFKPRITQRQSLLNLACVDMVPVEMLLVGHESGIVHYYAVEWASKQNRLLHQRDGMMTLLARINVHAQQICGLSWSPEGDLFATGGNDNACCLFEVSNIFGLGSDSRAVSPVVTEELFIDQYGVPNRRHTVIPGQASIREIVKGQEKFRWVHSAAVKAIAFCPWQRGLVATGGGSNDRCIHFYHTFSGACLATINVSAQVTSLIWSSTRREIAATFGYAQPEHPFRIAVFSWPDCQQIVAIPWSAEGRALSAVAYPGGPSDLQTRASGREGRSWTSRTAQEGCIVVASSDESIKFHEIWSETKSSSGGHKGLFGGSDILESIEGVVDKDFSELIR